MRDLYIKPAPDVDLEINSTPVDSFPSGSTIDVQLTDGTNPVTPDSVTVVGDVVTVQVPACPPAVTRSTATTPQTGQTTSYATGDDADTRNEGRPTDFFTLDAPPVHNDGSPTINTTTNRFTDINGLQVYSDDIVLDWDTWNGNTLLGYKRTPQASALWEPVVVNNFNISYGGFGNWRGWNIREYFRLINFENPWQSQFSAPFSDLNAVAFIWTSTTDRGAPANAYMVNNNGSIHYRSFSKTGTSRGIIIVRTFTLSTSNNLS